MSTKEQAVLRSEPSDDGSSSQEQIDVLAPARKRVKQDLSNVSGFSSALKKLVSADIDVTEHEAIMLQRQAREIRMKKDKEEAKIKQAIREERRALLDQGHVLPAEQTSPLEVRLKAIATKGTLQFLNYIALTAAEAEAAAKEREDKFQEHQTALLDSRVPNVRKTWKVVDKEQALNPVADEGAGAEDSDF
eukprot:gnl/Dysnectes_brevis/1091_a1221_4045.p1 GENE.gnl/Dysnectes_brevis/1091_a1221_4045~~gnl/Dysnectes_brevis/1091_a1221_4045.p1  ORF type:complete len:191 (-),score=40.85 gnl/Dysnectes_brevis/1091_a1221_4045:55-627(-)